MRTFLLLLPAGLSALTLAAHFLRRGAVAPVAACLVLLALLTVRRAWAARAVQAGMGVAVLVWAWTVAALVPARMARGEPWGRMAGILVAVALLALVAALAFEGATLRRRYRLGARGADRDRPAR